MMYLMMMPIWQALLLSVDVSLMQLQQDMDMIPMQMLTDEIVHHQLMLSLIDEILIMLPFDDWHEDSVPLMSITVVLVTIYQLWDSMAAHSKQS